MKLVRLVRLKYHYIYKKLEMFIVEEIYIVIW